MISAEPVYILLRVGPTGQHRFIDGDADLAPTGQPTASTRVVTDVHAMVVLGGGCHFAVILHIVGTP